MTKHEKYKKYIEGLKQDPIRLSAYIKKRREEKQRYRDKRKLDPIRYGLYIKKAEDRRRKRGVKKRIAWTDGETRYKRYYKRRPFWKMAKAANQWCKLGKVGAVDLWRLAKKQKLVCALTGDKLTTENISLDHIILQSKGGTNDITNFQLVTKRANIIKNDMSMNEFYLCCKKVVDHLKGEETLFPEQVAE